MTKYWIIKNHFNEYLIGFSPKGQARWQAPSREDLEDIAGSIAIVYSTEDLARVAVPALVNAEVDVFTVERHS